MFYAISADFFRGLINSLRIDSPINNTYINPKLRSLQTKVVRYLMIFYLISFLNYYLPTSVNWFLSHILNLVVSAFFFLHTIDLINILSNIFVKYRALTGLDQMSIAITLIIYQVIAYILVWLIIILLNYWPILQFMINYIILGLYHGFYCYNNYWQLQGLDITRRIRRYEIHWPYYLGYGTIPTILNLYPGLDLLYYFYVFNLLIIPFDHPVKVQKIPYPSLNLRFLSRITNFLINKLIT